LIHNHQIPLFSTNN